MPNGADLGEQPSTVHGWFLHWARRQPGAIAVRHGDRTVTYGRLDALSAAYAENLARAGVGPGHVVPVTLKRSPELVATLLAVLRCGAAYAVLDPDWPPGRLDPLLRQLPSPVVVTGVDAGGGGLRCEQGTTDRDVWLPTPADGDRAGQEPCAVFFTSGTTATPKGVVVPHAGTVLLFADCSFATLGPGAQMLQAAPLYWDGLTLELWSMLVTGGTSVLLEDSPPLTPAGLRALVERGLTVLWLTSSLFNLFVDEALNAFEGLPHVIIGGERLSPGHVRRFLARFPTTRLTNGYGPAEVTVFVTTHDIRAEDLDDPLGIPIGRAVPHTDLLSPAGNGAPAELMVAGPRVGLGYLDPGAPSGFAPFREVTAGREYPTGDLVVRRHELLSYVGREDRQVKVRGQRIAPQELEALLEELPSVRQARVVPVIEPSGATSGLAAFVIPAPGQDDVVGRARGHLEARARHLQPRYLTEVDHWPHTPTGKLDERSLLELARRSSTFSTPSRNDENGDADLLHEVAQLVGTDKVTADDDLLSLGASSLDLLQLAIRLERTWGRPVTMPPGALTCSLGQLGHILASTSHEPAAAAVSTVQLLDPVRASFLALHVMDPDDRASLCAIRWDLVGPIDRSALRSAIGDVYDTHQALHAVYDLGPPVVARTADSNRRPALLLEDDGRHGMGRSDEVLLDLLVATPLDLQGGEAFRALLSTDGSGDQSTLLVVAHHIAFDGWSEHVLARHLSEAYARRLQFESGPSLDPAPMQPLPNTTRHFRVDPGDGEFWQRHLTGHSDLVLRDSTGAPCADGYSCWGHRDSIELPHGTIRRWRGAARTRGRSLLPVLLAEWAAVLVPVLVEPDIVIGVPLTMPRAAAEADAVGCSINTLCVPLRASTVPVDSPAFVDQVDADVAASLRHAHVAFPDVVHLVAPARTRRRPLYQTIFALQDNTPPSLTLAGCWARHRRPAVPPPVDLLLEIWPEDEGRDLITLGSFCEHVPTLTASALLDAFRRRLTGHAVMNTGKI